MHDKLINAINSLKEVFPYAIGELINLKENGIGLQIQIGSKTGTGLLYVNEHEELILKTRYDQQDFIGEDDPVRDIAFVAWGWYLDYRTRGYDMCETWIPYWEKIGLIKKEVKTVTEYTLT